MPGTSVASPGATATPAVASVLPDVTGLDKQFDYLIPADLRERVHVGTLVRVELHGRRIGGWVTAVSDDAGSAAGESRGRPPRALKPILKVTGHGPDASILELAEWASVRWAARRIRPFVRAASPPTAVVTLPPSRRTGAAPAPSSPATRELLDRGGGVLRLPPRADVMPAILSTVARGPAIVVVPQHDTVAVLATRLRRAGLTVAVLPDEWALAAGGVDVVLGTRRAAWAPCPGLAAALVVDEHDESLQDERSPTWHARDVLVERCRRAGIPWVLVSPVPTLVAVEEYAGRGGVVHPPAGRERAGWPGIVVVDRTDEDPWKRSLMTSSLIERLRDPGRRVVCVSNITGRGRVLACRSCRTLIRCTRCDAAMGLDDDGRLSCRRCGENRPPVCQSCGASAFANLRPGVTRLREEIEAAAGRPVVSVTGELRGAVADADVYVGTEAVLHRVRTTDVVAFLEFDSELLAPRFRAVEQALALIVRAGRMAPEVLVQTFVPHHPFFAALRAGDPARLIDDERSRRRLLQLPPYAALAHVSGSTADEFAAGIGPAAEVGGGDGQWLVRAPTWQSLGSALNEAPRPTGGRLRIEVDPPRT